MGSVHAQNAESGTQNETKIEFKAYLLEEEGERLTDSLMRGEQSGVQSKWKIESKEGKYIPPAAPSNAALTILIECKFE